MKVRCTAFRRKRVVENVTMPPEGGTTYLLILTILAMTLVACSANEPSAANVPVPSTQPSPSPQQAQSGSTIAVGHGGAAPVEAATRQSGTTGKSSGSNAGGVAWTPPKGWAEGPERPMRAATYQVPAASGDKEGGECAVFFFGPGQGGAVQANIDRWIGQFEQPDGKPSSERATQKRETINGISVTAIDLSGTFLGGGPMMGGGGAKKPGYRLLGAIVEGPEGAVFFKLTGPSSTVRAAESDFRTMLKSLKK